jgi:hypothetical protein
VSDQYGGTRRVRSVRGAGGGGWPARSPAPRTPRSSQARSRPPQPARVKRRAQWQPRQNPQGEADTREGDARLWEGEAYHERTKMEGQRTCPPSTSGRLGLSALPVREGASGPPAPPLPAGAGAGLREASPDRGSGKNASDAPGASGLRVVAD